jgi:hypothetical protein
MLAALVDSVREHRLGKASSTRLQRLIEIQTGLIQIVRFHFFVVLLGSLLGAEDVEVDEV